MSSHDHTTKNTSNSKPHRSGSHSNGGLNEAVRKLTHSNITLARTNAELESQLADYQHSLNSITGSISTLVGTVTMFRNELRATRRLQITTFCTSLAVLALELYSLLTNFQYPQ